MDFTRSLGRTQGGCCFSVIGKKKPTAHRIRLNLHPSCTAPVPCHSSSSSSSSSSSHTREEKPVQAPCSDVHDSRGTNGMQACKQDNPSLFKPAGPRKPVPSSILDPSTHLHPPTGHEQQLPSNAPVAPFQTRSLPSLDANTERQQRAGTPAAASSNPGADHGGVSEPAHSRAESSHQSIVRPTAQARVPTLPAPTPPASSVPGEGLPTSSSSADPGQPPVNPNKQFVKALAGVRSLAQLSSLLANTSHPLDFQAVTAIGSCLVRLSQPHAGATAAATPAGASPSASASVLPLWDSAHVAASTAAASAQKSRNPSESPAPLTPSTTTASHTPSKTSLSQSSSSMAPPTPSPEALHPTSNTPQPSSTMAASPPPHETLHPPSSVPQPPLSTTLYPPPPGPPQLEPSPSVTLYPPQPEPLPRLHAFALRVWQPLLVARLPNSDAVGLSMCLQAAAHLHLLSPAITEPLLLSLEFQLHACTPHTLSQSLWALARLGISPPEPWLRRWTAAARPRLSRFKPRDLTLALWALAKLQWCPSEAWTQAVLSTLRASLPEFQPSEDGSRELATCVWALASLRRAPPPEFLDACLVRIEQLALAQDSAHRNLCQQQHEQQQHQQDNQQQQQQPHQQHQQHQQGDRQQQQQFSNQQDNLRQPQGKHQQQHHQQQHWQQPQHLQHHQFQHQQQYQNQQDRFQQQQQQQQQQQHPQNQQQQQLSRLAPINWSGQGFALGAPAHQKQSPEEKQSPGGQQNPGEKQSLEGELSFGEKRSSGEIQSLKGHCGVPACGTAGFDSDSSFAGSESASYHSSSATGFGDSSATGFCDRSTAGILSARSRSSSGLGPQALAMLAYALAVFQFKPSPSFVRVFVAVTYKCLHHAKPQELSLMAMALANWKVRPPSLWMAHLVAVSQPLLPCFSPQGLVLLTDAFAQLGYRPPPNWIASFEATMAYMLRHVRPTACAQVLASMGAAGYQTQGRLCEKLLLRMIGGSRHVLAKRWFPALLGATLLGLLRPPHHPSVASETPQPQASQQPTHAHREQPGEQPGLMQQSIHMPQGTSHHHIIQQARASAKSRQLLQLVLAYSVDKYAYCRAGNLAQLALTIAVWRCRQRALGQAAQNGGEEEDGGWEIVEGWLPGFSSALRQKVGLATAADVAALAVAASHFPSKPPIGGPIAPDRGPHSPVPSIHTSTKNSSSSSSNSFRDHSPLQIPSPLPHEQQQQLPQSLQQHHQQHQQPALSPDCLRLALLLLQACANNLPLYSLQDLLMVVHGATALGCSCNKFHPAHAGDSKAASTPDLTQQAPHNPMRGTAAGSNAHNRTSSIGSSGSTSSIGSTGSGDVVRPQLNSQGMEEASSNTRGSISSTSSTSNNSATSFGSGEVVRPQLNSQGLEEALRAAAAPVMQVVCDRVVQLVVEQPHPRPALAHAHAQQQSHTPLPADQQKGPSVLSSLSQESIAGGSKGGSHSEAIARIGVAKGLSFHLRSRALAMLESYGGGGLFGQVDGPSRFLQAWACLNEAAYFWAAPSRVRSCQLCVAMYSACERCFEQGPVSRQWLDEAGALAADMPIPPDPQWLRDCKSEGVGRTDTHHHVASH